MKILLIGLLFTVATCVTAPDRPKDEGTDGYWCVKHHQESTNGLTCPGDTGGETYDCSVMMTKG